MSDTHLYLVWWQWAIVVVLAFYSWFQDPTSIAGLFGAFVGAYLIVGFAAYINRNRERPSEATGAQG